MPIKDLMSEGPSADPPADADFVLVEGIRSTRGALDRWAKKPSEVLVPWFTGGLLVGVGLLTAVWLVSIYSTPDYTPFFLPGVTTGIDPQDYAYILSQNLLVLALHATACVAGFIAGNSLPLAAKDMTGFKKFVHEKAGPLAIWWVIGVTTFSLVAQSYALGIDGATIAEQLGVSTFVLILTVLPHALLELTAVFLPLAAWLIASRKNLWEDLLAATFVTVALAVPMLLLSGLIELYVWPELVQLVSPNFG